MQEKRDLRKFAGREREIKLTRDIFGRKFNSQVCNFCKKEVKKGFEYMLCTVKGEEGFDGIDGDRLTM